jgi:hypothetical protein
MRIVISALATMREPAVEATSHLRGRTLATSAIASDAKAGVNRARTWGKTRRLPRSVARASQPRSSPS